MRLDIYLCQNNFFKSRSRAVEAIKNSNVLVNNNICLKPSFEVGESDEIKIVGDVLEFVSRGGLKLEAAINNFKLDFKDKIIVDIGSSTGGFTDCSLKYGAKLVYAIDVGKSQLDPKLLCDKRVISLEQTNILDIDYFDNNIDYFVMDVSFVSITHIIPHLVKFLNDKNALICLIKPQFEVGKIYLKNGIIRDSNIHLKVVNNIVTFLNSYNLSIKKLIPSPILGGSGNKEFLAYISLGLNSNINVREVVKNA